MSYTHSWYRPPVLDYSDMVAISSDFEMVVRELPASTAIVEIPEHKAGRYDIAFRGRYGSVEDFVFAEQSTARVIDEGRARDPAMVGKSFEYCKTGRLPYDLAVCSCLVVAKRYLGESVRVETDGGMKDWAAVFEICERVLGYGGGWRIEGRVLTTAG